MSQLSVRHGASLAPDAATAVRELAAAVDQPGMKALILFCSSSYDLPALGLALKSTFPCPIVACTSSGQIGLGGYQAGGLTAASIAGDGLGARSYLIAPLADCHQRAARAATEAREALERMPPGRGAFAFLLSDGLAQAEEGLAAALYQALGDVPLVGGSAGDDLRFERTSVYWEGSFLSDAAVLTLFDTSLQIRPLRLQHYRPTARKLVITSAEPSKRLVREINGLPAAEAYAEVLGIPVEGLDAAALSAHPLMLRIGDYHYLRSVRRVNPDRSLSLFCAIDEGLVLAVGEGTDPLAALQEGFAEATHGLQQPELVLACDCILRRLELEGKGLAGAVGAFLGGHQVIGFSTYGEQFNGVHINQTFTGVALGT